MRLTRGQVPSLCEDLLSSIDQPLKVAKDKASKRDFLLCDYNRDGDSYRHAPPQPHDTHVTQHRSPWSNTYEPPIDDGATPSPRLRELEVQANQAFDTYRELYFEGGVSSVYLWDLEHGFAGVVLLKKGDCKRVLCRWLLMLFQSATAQRRSRAAGTPFTLWRCKRSQAAATHPTSSRPQ